MSRWIPRELGGAEMISIGGGLAHYRYAGKPDFVAQLPFINNSFIVLSTYRGAGLTFEKMAAGAARKTLSKDGGRRVEEKQSNDTNKKNGGTAIRDCRSFRVRFSRENIFEKVPKNVLETAEWAVMNNYDMAVDRYRPECEFWFIIRRDGPGYFGRLLRKRSNPKPEKGELRPELACLLCLDCDFTKKTVVCDPFAGHGPIPLYIHKHRPYGKLYVNDHDNNIYAQLKKSRLGGSANIDITCADATNLKHIGDGSVDLVVTDPPWGFVGKYDKIQDFYRNALKELKRILNDSGRIILLTGNPPAMAEAARHTKLNVESHANILVNGKKATVFALVKAGQK